jgi:hypothetical protein
MVTLFGDKLMDVQIIVPTPWGTRDVNAEEGSRRDVRDAAIHGGTVRNIAVPVIPDLDSRILAALQTKPNRLDMDFWHGEDEQPCGTTHCIAGWAVFIAGEAGMALEDRYDAETAGALIYAASRPGKTIPNFHVQNAAAMRGLKRRAAQEVAP